jgi:hypothetical protein
MPIFSDICNESSETAVNDRDIESGIAPHDAQQEVSQDAVNDHGVESGTAPHDNQQDSFFCCRRCLSGTYNATSADPASDGTSGSFNFSCTFNHDGSGTFLKSEVGDRNSASSNQYMGQWRVGGDGTVTLSASNEFFHFKVCCDNNLEVMPVTIMIGLFGFPRILQRTAELAPKLYQSISISNLFKLIDHIKSEVDGEAMRTIISNHKRGDLCQNSIDSDFLKIFFEQKNIYPPHEFESYFSKNTAKAVLSYQWTLDFRKIKAFLCASNLREHNLTTIGADSIFVINFLYGWLCFNHSASLDEDTTIWIDILFNNQLQKRNFPAILEKADYEYSTRPIHIALSTDQLLSRVWIINEFAKIKQAGKTTILVTAGGREGKRIKQLPRKAFMIRAISICLNKAQDIESDYYENLQATVEEDKRQIRDKLLEIYGTKDEFNREIGALVESVENDTDFLWIAVYVGAGSIAASCIWMPTVLYNGSESILEAFNSSFTNASIIPSSNVPEPLPFGLKLFLLFLFPMIWLFLFFSFSIMTPWIAFNFLREKRYSPFFCIL